MQEDRSGFQLIGRPGGERAYPGALSVSDVRGLLDPPESGAGQSDLSADRRARSVEHLDALTALADRVEWKPLDRSHCKTEAAAFALVLRSVDPIDPGARLHAMVARAYLDASRFADAYAQVVSDTASARGLLADLGPLIRTMIGDSDIAPARDLGAAYLKGDGPLQRAQSIAARFRIDPPEAVKGREDDATAFFGMLNLVLGALESCEKSVSAHGAVPDVARLVFVLRLLEVFAMATRASLVFDGTYRKRNGNLTADLITSALELTGLGADGLDSLLRRVGSAGPPSAAGVGDLLRGWANPSSSDFTAYRVPIHHGDFPSAGYLTDVRLTAADSWL